MAAVRKTLAGITGFDAITGGGLPRGRVSLVCGGPGTGKSLLALQFLVFGATAHGEAGVFASFEETPEELAENVASLGWDVTGLAERKQLALEHIRADRRELTEAGEYDLEALFVRLGHAIDLVDAKRVALDSVGALFGALREEALLRHELGRLFDWLKDRGLTTIVTAERGAHDLTRHGLEEYASDCVILLDQRIQDETATRRMRIIKYRGSAHGSDEHPFIIDADGLSVFPLSSVSGPHEVSSERVSTGVRPLDAMLRGGYYRGSVVLLSGGPGTGKTSLAAAFARATCQRGERCLYFAMEEPPSQLVRNMGSIGVDLEPLVREGTLEIAGRRATQLGLEGHLAVIHKGVFAFKPTTVIVDPLSAFAGEALEITAMLMRTINFLKVQGITVLLTALVREDQTRAISISSLADSWLELTNVEHAGERNRGISLIKSRGSAHSNQVREFVLSDDGIDIVDAYAGEAGLLMGSARSEVETREQATSLEHDEALAATRRRVEARRVAFQARIAALKAEAEAELAAADAELANEEARHARLVEDRRAREARRASGSHDDASPT